MEGKVKKILFGTGLSKKPEPRLLNLGGQVLLAPKSLYSLLHMGGKCGKIDRHPGWICVNSPVIVSSMLLIYAGTLMFDVLDAPPLVLVLVRHRASP